jgi:shikimate kinase
MRLSENKRNNLILIGMPASGKSTIGVLLAKVTNRNFIDSDIVIQKRTGKLLKELISENGPEGFARIEDDINSEIECDNTIIATGGSAIFGKNAMKHFSETGTIVYLRVDHDSLLQRIGDLDERGVVHEPGETLLDIMKKREPLYERYADITVNEPAGIFTVDDILNTVLNVINSGEQK